MNTDLKPPEQGVIITCDNGHEGKIFLTGHTREMAIDFGQIYDGTSPIYVYPPREYPIGGSMVSKCGICRAWVSCRIFGYDDN